jgi:hypothetical protein
MKYSLQKQALPLLCTYIAVEDVALYLSEIISKNSNKKAASLK